MPSPAVKERLKRVSKLLDRHLGGDDLEKRISSHLDESIEACCESEKPFLSPFLPSSVDAVITIGTVLPKALDEEDILGPSSVFVDLGCGDGRVVIGICHAFGCKGVGVDVSKDLIDTAIQCQEEMRMSGCNISWVNWDMSLETTESAYVRLMDLIGGTGLPKNCRIVCYLYVYKQMLEKLMPLAKKLCSVGAVIITNRYHFADWTPCATVDRPCSMQIYADVDDKFL